MVRTTTSQRVAGKQAERAAVPVAGELRIRLVRHDHVPGATAQTASMICQRQGSTRRVVRRGEEDQVWLQFMDNGGGPSLSRG